MQCFFNLAGALDDADMVGIDVASPTEARLEAVRYIGQLISDTPNLVWTGQGLRVEVIDSEHRMLCAVVVTGIDPQAAAG